MRKLRFAFFLILLLTFFSLPAYAGDLVVNVSANPSSMVEAQDVEFRFTIKNNGESATYGTKLLFPEANGQNDLDQLLPGESKSISVSYAISADDLESGNVTFALTHSDTPDGTVTTQEILVPITKESEEPGLEFTRQLSCRYVYAGDTLTVVYQLKNTGNVPLNALTLKDPLGDYSSGPDTLAVGETRSYINRVTIDAAASSMPTVNFTSSYSGQSYAKSLSEVPIHLAEEALIATLSVSEDTVDFGSPVTLTLTLKNDGNISFSDITLTEDTLGTLESEPLALPSGSDPLVIKRTFTLKADTDFRVHISAKTDAGTTFETDTETVTVHTAAPSVKTGLTIDVEPSAYTLNTTGNVAFTVTLTNNSPTDLSRVTLSESSRGDIRTFDVIPAGEPTVREQFYEISEESTFLFTATYTDILGNVFITESDPITITISEEGVSPHPTTLSPLEALTQGKPILAGSIFVYPIMLVILALIVVTLLILLVRSSARRKRARRTDQTVHSRKQTRLGKTNKFKPVRKNAPDEKE